MNWTIIVIEALVLTAAFTMMMLIPHLLEAGLYAWLFC